MRVPQNQILVQDEILIIELNVRTNPRSDLAAFWAGHHAGMAGDPIPKTLDFEEPSIFRRAHAAGLRSRKELT